MTNEAYPITPPPELVRRWIKECDQPGNPRWQDYEKDIADRAAQWGYDQRGEVNEAKLQQARDEELEACCEEMKSLPSPLGFPFGEMASSALRDARRPKPPSLKRVALLQLDTLNADLGLGGKGVDLSQIRRALEALPDD